MKRLTTLLVVLAPLAFTGPSAGAIDGFRLVPRPQWQYHRGGPTGYGRIGFSAYRGFGYGYRGYPRYQYRAYDPRYGYPGSWIGQGRGFPFYTYWGWGSRIFSGPVVSGTSVEK